MVSETVHIPTGKYDWLHAFYERAASDQRASERTLVIMIHDFPASHKTFHHDLYGEIEYQLIQRGFDTIRFDFRGCGESTGKSGDITFQTLRQDLKAVYSWADEKGYHRLVVIGEGLGAALAVMEQPPELTAMVFLWPLVSARGSALGTVIDGMATAQDDKSYVMYNNVRTGKGFLKQLAAADLTGYIAKIKVPLLIQHGLKDEIVPPAQLDFFREHATESPRVEIMTYESGGHGLARRNERKALYDQILQFLQKYA